MSEIKLKIGFVSNCPVAGKTGLARNMKSILPLLYKSDKYEIFFLAQGMSDNDPNFQKLPFKVEGVFRNFDQNRFNQDQNYQRIIAYGNSAVEEFVIKNKLDILVLADDQWGFINECYLNTDWFNHMKQNILPIITADSEPLMPQIKEWAEKVPNMKFWTSFATRILNEENPEKYKHCGVIYGALDSNDFYPLSKKEKLDLRNKFDIKDDEKIIMYLGRNQLRKIYASHIEGLVKFRKKYPEKKVRLLFHCSWSEPGGWPLNQIREQYGLNREDILTTYYCRNCHDWNIQPYQNEDLDCSCCNAKGSRVTAGVGSTINEKDLNKIYNIADGSASIFTSGAFEFTNPESMLAGIPLACPNYVCGEDFIKSGLVYEIKGNYTWEHNSGFRKFVPNTDSVCDFFNYIYDLSNDDKLKLCNEGRQWAIKNFDSKNIVKIYEEFFDSCKPIDWDIFLNKKKELKNVNAQIQDKQDDKEFIIHSYKEILNMTVDENDSGYQHWKKFLSQPLDKNKLKNEMIIAFRNAALQHNQKVNPQIPFDSLLDPNDKERCLLILKESLGDHILLTSLIPEIQNKYPNARIYISCEEKYFDIYENLPYNIKLLRWTQEQEQELLMCGVAGNKRFFDYFHNIGLTTQRSLNYINSKYE